MTLSLRFVAVTTVISVPYHVRGKLQQESMDPCLRRDEVNKVWDDVNKVRDDVNKVGDNVNKVWENGPKKMSFSVIISVKIRCNVLRRLLVQ